MPNHIDVQRVLLFNMMNEETLQLTSCAALLSSRWVRLSCAAQFKDSVLSGAAAAASVCRLCLATLSSGTLGSLEPVAKTAIKVHMCQKMICILVPHHFLANTIQFILGNS